MDVDFQGLKYATACFNVWRTVINNPYQDNIKKASVSVKTSNSRFLFRFDPSQR